jgi:predicted nucleic acid-binding protein
VNTFVPDASVAVKWMLPRGVEPFRSEALAWLRRFAAGEIRFVVPDLFWAELVNLLWKSVRLGRCSKSAACYQLKSLRSLRIPTVSSLELLDLAFGIANAHGRTVYDSLYVALAVHAKAPLVTADERLANTLAAHFPVKWVGAV